MKTWMMVVAVSLAACGGKPGAQKPSDPVVVKPVEVQPAGGDQTTAQILTMFDGMKTEMCACQTDDRGCGQAVIDKLSKAAKSMSKNPKMSPDEEKRAMDISMGFSECMGRVMGKVEYPNPCGGGGGDPCGGGGDPCGGGGDPCGDPCGG